MSSSVHAGHLVDDLGIDGHLAVGVVAAVELDGEPPRVLAALVHDVVDDHRVRVPVVVPDAVNRLGVERPDLVWLFGVERDDAEPGVSRTRVEERESVGVECHRTLDDVSHVEVGAGPLSGLGVQEVDLLVVRTEDDLGDAIRPLPHHGLAGPSAAAPDLVLLADGRLSTHGVVGESPGLARGRSSERVPSRRTCGWDCRGTS